MSAAPQPVRRPMSQAAARPAQAAARPARETQRGSEAEHSDLRVNVADIPRIDLRTDLEVEGFKPSLLSRIFGMFSRS